MGKKKWKEKDYSDINNKEWQKADIKTGDDWEKTNNLAFPSKLCFIKQLDTKKTKNRQNKLDVWLFTN